MNCLTSVQSGCFQEARGDYYKIGSKVIYDKAEIQAWPQLQLTSEVLICDAKMREYFVKLEIISKPNSHTICISFHKAEHPMSYHLKNKSEQEYQRIRKKLKQLMAITNLSGSRRNIQASVLFPPIKLRMWYD